MGELEVVTRLVLSLLLSTLVGIERQWHHKHAGIKTNALVAVGATAFALVSTRAFGPGANPAQVAAGVVTGIGFIGAGVVIRRGGSVQGINSAATLWASASMGLAIGAGYYRLALPLAVVILSIQLILSRLANWLDRKSGLVLPSSRFRLAATFHRGAAPDVRAAWTRFEGQSGVEVYQYAESQESDDRVVLEACFALSETHVSELAPLSRSIAAIPGVTRTEWSHAKTGEEE